jgi:hypothetical protein
MRKPLGALIVVIIHIVSNKKEDKLSYRIIAIIVFVFGVLITGCAQIEKPVIGFQTTRTTTIMNEYGTYKARVYSREPCILIQIEVTSNNPLPELGNN